MPGFHTPRQQSPIPTRQQDLSYVKRRKYPPAVSSIEGANREVLRSRPGTPELSEREFAQAASLSRPTTPLSIISRKFDGQSPRLTPDSNRALSRDLKQWSLIWDNDREDFVAVPCTDSQKSVRSDVPEDVDIFDEFVFVLEESTPMLESFEDVLALHQPFRTVTSSIMEKQEDPDSSFLEFEESE